MSRFRLPLVLTTILALFGCSATTAEPMSQEDVEAIRELALLQLASGDRRTEVDALMALGRHWDNRLTPALLEFVHMTRHYASQKRAINLLHAKTGKGFGYELDGWFSWSWQQSFDHPGYYADYKSRLYRRVDPRFAKYFSSEHESEIRLDEVRWGGVVQDGIPPLRQPDMIAADKARYLRDDHVVFGLEVNGDARAYPKRILAWHEMFVDDVGDVPVVGVYCTLCGSMILYETTVEGTNHQMGTSGFLYRSNKLMYDEATQSLWSTLRGAPVIGPLVGRGIELPRRSVVTTTWGEWKRRHPQTKVLSLKTGHNRNYGEGVAYREYFATDELMFHTSQVDKRLANKAEVLGLIFGEAGVAPLAISADYAMKHPVIHETVGSQAFVVLTDESGAMRVYETNTEQFEYWDRDRQLRDSSGKTWTLHEDRLVREDGVERTRLPSHSAFWFGWYGAFTNTRLLS